MFYAILCTFIEVVETLSRGRVFYKEVPCSRRTNQTAPLHYKLHIFLMPIYLKHRCMYFTCKFTRASLVVNSRRFNQRVTKHKPFTFFLYFYICVLSFFTHYFTYYSTLK